MARSTAPWRANNQLGQSFSSSVVTRRETRASSSVGLAQGWRAFSSTAWGLILGTSSSRGSRNSLESAVVPVASAAGWMTDSPVWAWAWV
jgi:hypothetical protein